MVKTFGQVSNLFDSKYKLEHKISPAPKPPRVPTYQITPEIREILNLLESTEGKIIFVTGAAGTGKSTLIDILRSETSKKLVVVAPTGVAAINSGGQTIHSLIPVSSRTTAKAEGNLGYERPCAAK